MIVKRVFDIMDRDGDGLISFEDFARGIFPLASAQVRACDVCAHVHAHMPAHRGAGACV